MTPPLSDQERPYVESLRKIFRSYQLLLTYYESTGKYEVVDDDRVTWNILDLKWIVDHLDDCGFPPQQAKAVRLMLINDMAEKDAARALGCPGTPVGPYVTEALRHFSPMVQYQAVGGSKIRPSRLPARIRARLFDDAA